MKKSILNIGKELSNNEQKNVIGGYVGQRCFTASTCGTPPVGTVYRCINRKCILELLGGV